MVLPTLRKIGPGRRGERNAEVEQVIIVFGMQRVFVYAKLEQFQRINFAAQTVENQAPVTVERFGLVRVAGQTAELMHFIEYLIKKVVPVALANAVGGSEGEGVAQFGRAGSS